MRNVLSKEANKVSTPKLENKQAKAEALASVSFKEQGQKAEALLASKAAYLPINKAIQALNLGLASGNYKVCNITLAEALEYCGRGKGGKFGLECITLLADKQYLLAWAKPDKDKAEDLTFSFLEGMKSLYSSLATEAKGTKAEAKAKEAASYTDDFYKITEEKHQIKVAHEQAAKENRAKEEAKIADLLKAEAENKGKNIAKAEAEALAKACRLIQGRKDSQGRYTYKVADLLASFAYTKAEALAPWVAAKAKEAENKAKAAKERKAAKAAKAAKEAEQYRQACFDYFVKSGKDKAEAEALAKACQFAKQVQAKARKAKTA